MFKLIAIAALVAYVSAEVAPKPAGIVKIVDDANNVVTGTVTFTQTDKGIQVTGEIKGLTEGKHGFHIHQKGDVTGGCMSTGGHFNPENKHHGDINATERHVGDLGNIEANSAGVAVISILDKHITLSGAHSILGRAVVVHSGEDDLGKGGHNDSLTTGHAGGRAGCGVIGILNEVSGFANIISTSFTVIISGLVFLRLATY